MSEDRGFLHFDEVLKRLKIERKELLSLISEGDIRAIRGSDGSVLFREDEVLQFEKQIPKNSLGETDTGTFGIADDFFFEE